jgi:hypothetical protein
MSFHYDQRGDPTRNLFERLLELAPRTGAASPPDFDKLAANYLCGRIIAVTVIYRGDWVWKLGHPLGAELSMLLPDLTFYQRCDPFGGAANDLVDTELVSHVVTCSRNRIVGS